MIRKLLILFFLVSMNNAFAQYYSCRVNLVDNYSHRVVRTFIERPESGQSACYIAQRECRKYIRMQGLDPRRYDCHQAGNTPGSGPGPIGVRERLLRLNDRDLVQAAMNRDAGWCEISRSFSGACDYYMSVRNQSYPDAWGTGCVNARYTAQYGCSHINELNNAACLLRRALHRGDCGL